MDRSALLALAARAEAGGDDALSWDCWRALGNVHWTGDLWHHPDKLGPFRLGDLQSSLDAAEEVGPPIINLWQQSTAGTVGARVDRFHAEALGGGSGGLSCAPTECLARLAAKLRAMAIPKAIIRNLTPAYRPVKSVEP